MNLVFNMIRVTAPPCGPQVRALVQVQARVQVQVQARVQVQVQVQVQVRSRATVVDAIGMETAVARIRAHGVRI
ncbi:hypothetical protein [Streptomyces sp. NPDC058385]|uniref:hypothetical protein n=1 Tax=Streptomyces sp. NPDC058385 TaxID=3346473 RepID=UPI003658A23C